MPWKKNLIDTYDNNTSEIGNLKHKIPLLPICHTTCENAYVTIIIDGEGNLLDIIVSSADGKSVKTIIPCTEGSDGRSSGLSPHPLSDKLQYVAGDYKEFGGGKKHGFKLYEELLKSWSEFDCSNPKIKAVYEYVSKGNMIKDFIDKKVFFEDGNGDLIKKYKSPRKKPQSQEDEPDNYFIEKTPLFKRTKAYNYVDSDGVLNIAVRFSVEIKGDNQSDLWTDKCIWDNWIDYYKDKKTKEDGKAFCHVYGEYLPYLNNHPKKIRNPGDKCRLISSNDKSNFTYRGIYSSPEQACVISMDASYKMHNALRYLYGKQGVAINELSLVAWSVGGYELPSFFDDSCKIALKGIIDINDSKKEEISYTSEEIGRAFAKKMRGYSVMIPPNENIIVLGVDSPSLDGGRLAVCEYYRLTGSDYLSKINDWHSKCRWKLNIEKNREFIGAPSPLNIIKAAYGKKINEKSSSGLKKKTISRLIQCIIRGNSIPDSIVENCVRRCSKRNTISQLEWRKNLGITCAVYKYSKIKERKYDMVLDKEIKRRGYLYGRLLAVAEYIEKSTFKRDGKRSTNAERYIQKFSSNPFSTWTIIRNRLASYSAKLKSTKFWAFRRAQNAESEIMSNFVDGEFQDNSKIDGDYLMGYFSQMEDFYTSTKDEKQ